MLLPREKQSICFLLEQGLWAEVVREIEDRGKVVECLVEDLLDVVGCMEDTVGVIECMEDVVGAVECMEVLVDVIGCCWCH